VSKPILTQEYLRSLFDYDAETGVLTRKICTANRHKLGEIVGYSGARGYRQAMAGGRKYMVHNLIWMWVHGKFPEGVIDHINRVRHDNRLANLREVTRSENNHNMSISSANWSGFTGAAWDKSRSQWLASIRANGKQHHLGRFNTPQEASAAYLAAKAVYHLTAPL
jgi:hypothetical protein